MHKYIFVSGGVLSGLGKGISTASISLLLKLAGYKVCPIKCENYLNVDAGTINPIEHGDPFLCEDGTEADMDMGTYEKFLDINMTKDNFITMGQIYKHVIEKERRFEYKGEDVQEVVHITGEIISRINLALKNSNAQIAVIELGGTAGEYQNILYYEANRILSFSCPGDVIHIHVSYLPTPKHLGEPKTKPAQLSVRMVNSIGIQPDMLITRSEKPIDKRRKERLGLFCNIHDKDIISSYDVPSVYQVPLVLENQNITKQILTKLSLKTVKPDIKPWQSFVNQIYAKKDNNVNIAIVGKYFKTGEYNLRDSYAALFDAIDHAAWENNISVKIKWIDAEKLELNHAENYLQDLNGIIVPIGWGKRGAEGMIKAASYARDNKIPYLGLCYGMQLAVIAFARDILGYKNADTIENNKNTQYPVIHMIPNQKAKLKRRAYGGTMRLGGWQAIVKKNTIAWDIYNKHDQFINKKDSIMSERHRHRYEFNNKYAKVFENNGLIISARSKIEYLVEIIELDPKLHPFYLGIQGHPEYKSRPLKPHGIFLEFLDACIRHKQ